MRKRSYDSVAVQKPKRKSDKKVCDLGRRCPYQEEYQHLMEFSHDCEPVQRAPVRQFNAFAGQGVRLGAADGTDFNPPVQQRPSSWQDAICCEVCSQKVPIYMIEAHLATHNGNKSVNKLKRDQDGEYEQSVLEDVQRQSAVEATRQQELQREREAKEAAELEEVLQKSIMASNKAAREQALQQVQAEPGPDYDGIKILLKFTLPSGAKLKRSFRADSSLQDAFTYLRSLEELEGVEFILRDALNTVALEPGDTRTFEGAGVRSSSSLIVVAVEAPGRSGAIQDDARAMPATSSGPSSSSSAATSSVRVVIGASSSSSGRGAVDSDGVIVLDDSLVEVTPKVRRKRKLAGTGGGDAAGAEVVDLTFS